MRRCLPFTSRHTLIVFLSAVAGPMSAATDAAAPFATQVIELDGKGPGRVFDGIGGLSAGAASRLLIDYPEPQRSQILDYLFKPNFGASLHDLKVEIGGAVNSTWGAEPSHANTRNEFEHPKPEYYERGYEWWLMKEARKRNPAVILESLQWGAPGWIGNGDFFSQDNADFIAEFIKGAKKYHDLTINFQGIRNEAGYKVAWIKTLRKTLDRNGLRDVKLVAADDPGDVEWKIVKDMMADAELRDAVYAAGIHYVPYTSTEAAKQIGKPLWCSEEARYGEPWGRAKNFARLYNRNYIIGRMTKTIVCTPITSLFENLVPFNVEIWNNPGLMKANTPWSGHYEVPPAIWVTAHTTQFALPGWRYIDGGCGLLKTAGSYVTLRSPDPNGHYSIIIETMSNLPYDQANASVNAKDEDTAVPPCRVQFSLKNLSTGAVHVWRSTKSAQFEQLPDITPEDGSFALTLDGNSIYSLTTTTGQHKGAYDIPKDSPFPFPYSEDFESYAPGSMARYLSDQEGTFVVAKRSDGRGQCLRQIVPQPGIKWFVNVESPWTITGNAAWKNYEVSVDVHIPEKASASLYGRIDAAMSRMVPGGYGLTLDSTGVWQLKDTGVVLRSGEFATGSNAWHNLRLRFTDFQICAQIDGKTVCSLEDDFHPSGAVGLVASYGPVDFDNLTVQEIKDPVPPPARSWENLAQGRRTTASSQLNDDTGARKATDGNHISGWCPAAGKKADQWLEVDLGGEVAFNYTLIDQHQTGFGYAGSITGYKIQYWSGNEWRDAAVGKNMAIRQTNEFPAVTARKVRLLITSCSDQTCVFEFKVYSRKQQKAGG